MKQAVIKNKISRDKKGFLDTEIPSKWDLFELGDLFEFKNVRSLPMQINKMHKTIGNLIA